MNQLLTLIIFIMYNNHLTLANIFGEPNLSYQEVAALLGIITIIGGAIVKVFYKDGNELSKRVEVLELKFVEQSTQIKEIIKDFKDMINRLEENINQEREGDNLSSSKAIDKIDARIEKLTDYIMKLIEKV